MALITTWWYRAARAAPTKGPTQKIHCATKNAKRLEECITSLTWFLKFKEKDINIRDHPSQGLC